MKVTRHARERFKQRSGIIKIGSFKITNAIIKQIFKNYTQDYNNLIAIQGK